MIREQKRAVTIGPGSYAPSTEITLIGKL